MYRDLRIRTVAVMNRYCGGTVAIIVAALAVSILIGIYVFRAIGTGVGGAVGAVGAVGTEGFEAPKMRPCAVYYTDNIAACDHPGRLYEQTPQWRETRLAALMKIKAPSEAERTEIQLLRDIKQEGAGAPKYCKVTLTDFTEKAEDPYKMAKNAAVRGAPDHWAFCFKANPDRAAAEATVRDFGDRSAIYTNMDYITTMGDANVYNRIQFRDLKFDTVKYASCLNSPPSLDENLPVLLAFKVNPYAMTLTKVLAFKRGANGQLSAYPNPLELFARLFRTQGENNQYVLKPVRTNLVVYKVSKNMCNHDTIYGTFPMTVDLSRLGLRTTVLVSGLPYASPNRAAMVKGIADIQMRMVEVGATIADLEKKYADITANKAGGLHRNVFLINNPDHWPQNTGQMNTLFANRVRLVKQDTDTIVHFRNNTRVPGVTEGYAIEWRGMLRITEKGSYAFKVNSDDAADAYVDGKLVTTYYGGHGFGDAGTSLVRLDLDPGFYPIHIRMMEWWGGDGMELSVRKNAEAWKLVPTSWFYYSSDPSINAYIQGMETSRQNMKMLEARKAEYERWIGQLQGNQANKLKAYADQMVSKDISGIFQRSHLSDGDVIYMDVGAYMLAGASPGMPGTGLGAGDGDDSTGITNGRQILVNNLLELNVPRTVPPPQVPLYDTPKYSVSMWLKITDGATQWRNILFYGAGDDWTDWTSRRNNNPRIDRTPGFWVYPDSTARLHYRHRARTPDGFNDGIDVTDLGKVPAFKQWFHYTTTINRNVASTYINGELAATRTLAGNFEWNNINAKKLVLGNNGISGGIFLQKLYWYNRVVSADEIRELAKEVGVNEVVEVTARSVGWGGCTAAHYGSGKVVINRQNFSFARGMNVYTVADDGTVKWSQWDSYANTVNNGGGKAAVVSALTEANLVKQRVLVALIHDEGTNQLSADVRTRLRELGSGALASARFRSPYLFIKDLRRNKVIIDRAGRENACDAIEWTGAIEYGLRRKRVEKSGLVMNLKDLSGDIWLDGTGNGYDAYYVGGVQTVSKYGGGITTPASQTQRYVLMPEKALQDLPNGTAWTLSWWMEVLSHGATRYCMSMASASYHNALIIQVNRSTITLYDSKLTAGRAIPYALNELVNITVVRSGNTFKLFKNGQLFGTYSVANQMATNTKTIQGWVLDQEQDTVKGAFDSTQNLNANWYEISLFNRTLSDAEVMAEYNGVKGRFG